VEAESVKFEAEEPLEDTAIPSLLCAKASRLFTSHFPGAAWSFVQKKANKPWIWIAMDAKTRQIIACHVGERRGESGKELWANMPMVSREQATCHTDHYAV
jgi:hypothetical protein